MTDSDPAATPFHDLDAYVDLPRGSGLALSPDGTRLVTAVQTLNPKRTKFVTALWEVDPTGERPAHRLTRSAKGEGGAAFLPDGSLLFVSARPDPATDDDDKDDESALWLLPAAGGEARVVSSRPGGVDDVRVAADAGTIVLAAGTFPSSTDEQSEKDKRKERKEKKVSAILHESVPVRFWDHDLGPDVPRLFAGSLATDGDDAGIELTDLTPTPGRALVEGQYDVSPDGSTVATTWAVPERGGQRIAMAIVDVATGERRVLLDDLESEYDSPRFSPDGSQLALVVEKRSTPTDPGDRRLAVVTVADGTLRDLSGDWDRWPGQPEWTPDGSALVLHADEDGRSPVFRVDVSSGEFTRLTGDPFAYSDVQVSPDGSFVYAMRTSYAEPLRPVRLDASTPDQQSVALRGPSETPALPGRLEDVETTAEDGTRVRSWLCLPGGCVRRLAGAAAAVDPRWSARLVERLVVAVEPLDRRGAGVRRAAARPGSLHRLRAGLHRPRLGCLGRGAVHRPDVGDRRDRRP